MFQAELQEGFDFTKPVSDDHNELGFDYYQQINKLNSNQIDLEHADYLKIPDMDYAMYGDRATNKDVQNNKSTDVRQTDIRQSVDINRNAVDAHRQDSSIKYQRYSEHSEREDIRELIETGNEVMRKIIESNRSNDVSRKESHQEVSNRFEDFDFSKAAPNFSKLNRIDEVHKFEDFDK